MASNFYANRPRSRHALNDSAAQANDAAMQTAQGAFVEDGQARNDYVQSNPQDQEALRQSSLQEQMAAAQGAVGASSRPEMRQPMREEDPRDRAARRAMELREHLGDGEEGTDDFYVDPAIIPPGWAYEWKRRVTFGAEDPAYQVQLRRAGWEAVPTSRHPELMPLDGNYSVIERKGMVLMERPKEINDEAQDREYRKARNQVRQKEQQLNSADPGQFERRKSDGETLVKVNKSYERIAIPQE